MGEVELTKFTGGLVLKPTDDDLQIHQVQEAKNVDFVREPGAVRPRRGINKHLSTLFDVGADIFWSRVLTSDAMIVRSGASLYKNNRLINLAVTNATMRFAEFSNYIIMANGIDTLKYKDTGMSLSWNSAYSQFWEASALDSTSWLVGQDSVYAAVLPFQLAVVTGDDYFCCHNWEVEHLEDGTATLTASGFYTSSCYIGLTFGSAASNTKLLLHCNGSGGGQTFSDSSVSGHTVTVVGDVETYTDWKKFGTASLRYFGSYADGLTIPDHADWNMGTGKLTLEAWVRWPTVPTNSIRILSQDAGIWDFWDFGWSSAGALHFVIWEAGPTQVISVSYTWTPVADTTYHIALIRGWGGNANDWALTIDGTAVATATESITWPDLAASLEVATKGTVGQSILLDEIRITKGEARWTADFTPATEAYGEFGTALATMDLNIPVDLGLTAPSSTLTATDSGGGAGGPDGTYTYKVTYYNNDGFESDVSSASTAETVVDNDIDLTVIPISPDPQVVGRKIYRIAHAGTTYKLVTTIENNHETTYTDEVADGDLGADAPTSHSPPPAFSEVHSHKSLLWGIDAANKNKAFYCTSFDEWEYFVSTNYEAFGSKSDETQALATLAEYLVPVQKIRIWKLNTEEATWEKAESLSKRGSPSSRAVLTIGDALLIVDGTGIYYFDTIKDIMFSQVIEPIFDTGGEYDERISSSYYENLAVGFLDEMLYISYTRNGRTLNDRTIVYHRESKTFQGVITQGFSSFTVDKELKAIYGAGTDGYIYRLDNGTTDEASATISWSFTTKDLDKELVTQSYELTGGKLTAKGIGKLVYKRGGKIRLDLDPSGEEVTVAVYLDGTSRQSRVYDDAARVVKEIILDPDYDFYRLALKFSGSTDSLVKIHSVRITAEEIT